MGDWVGGLVFAVVVLGGLRYGWWVWRQVRAYEPHCVYKIPLTDGRIYIGFCKDPDKRINYHRSYQRPLAEGNPRKWWPYVPEEVRDARPLRMPPEWIDQWYRSKPLAHEAEVRLIRRYEEAGAVVLANRMKYRSAVEVGGGGGDE